MSKVKIDSSFQQMLSGITEISEIVDGNGKVIGIFKPKCLMDAELVAIAAKLFDPADLDRIEREESGKGIPYTEVKKRLQALENQG